jgi:hypothetical protein
MTFVLRLSGRRSVAWGLNHSLLMYSGGRSTLEGLLMSFEEKWVLGCCDERRWLITRVCGIGLRGLDF